METIFSLGNLVVMPFWLLMIAAPRWRWTHRLVTSPWIVIAPAVAYAALVAPQLPALLPLIARPQLVQVAGLLGTEAGATIAWLHFLAFDLFVGRWVFLDARERGLPWWRVSPLLLATLLVGPLGLLLYLATRGLGARDSRWMPASRIGPGGVRPAPGALSSR